MPKKPDSQIKQALRQFCLEGTPVSFAPYGNGHINDTYLVTTDQKRYILQAINHFVFKEPALLMENIERVTAFLRRNARDPREVLTLVPTLSGDSFYHDPQGDFWRVYLFLENSICLDRVESPADFYECAAAFGKFQRDLSSFPAETLHETIPDFHNTPKRYRDFLQALERDPLGRAAAAQKEIAFVKARADFYPLLLEASRKGDLPLRVSHNDTKSNNVMLDAVTRKALCVIDLDTIMPGFSVTDFGDAIRFGASTAAEDEQDLDRVRLDLDLFKVYTEGFLTGAGHRLTESEVLLLPEGAKMMTIECGMRFLADYLEGDVYFKTAYPEHNLVRARTQFKLVEEMERYQETLKEIVRTVNR